MILELSLTTLEYAVRFARAGVERTAGVRGRRGGDSPPLLESSLGDHQLRPVDGEWIGHELPGAVPLNVARPLELQAGAAASRRPAAGERSSST